MAVAFAAGIGLCDLASLDLTACLCAAALALAVATRLQRPLARAAAVVASVGACGAAALSAELALAARDAPSRTFEATLEARVCAARLGRRAASVLLCRVERAVPGEPGMSEEPDRRMAPQPPRRLTLLAWRRDADAFDRVAALLPGQAVRARLRVGARVDRANPGGSDSRRRARRRGIGATAWLVHPALLVRRPDRDAPSLVGLFARPRRELALELGRRGDGRGLLRALALGERSGFGEDAVEAFRRLGVAHLLAVSGLHLALVAGLAFACARAALARVPGLAQRRDPRLLALGLSLAAAFGYAGLTGWGTPVRRALLFAFAAGAALLLRRPASAAGPLSVAALVVLAAEPAALFELGAQLSFAASAALLAAVGRSDDHALEGRSLLGRARRSLSISALALGATAPLLAAHGLPVAPAALLANGVLVPWTAIVLLPAAGFATAAVALPRSAATDAIVSLASALGDASVACVQAVAALAPPLSERPAPAVLGLVGAGLLAVALVRARGVVARVAWAGGICAVLQWAPQADVSPGPPRVVAFDVGSGDALLLQGSSASALVDGGLARSGAVDLGRSVVVPALRRLGVTRLDLIVATHADADHAGGLRAVLRSVPSAALWIPRGARQDPGLAALLASARDRGVPVLERGAGDAAWEAGDLRVVPLWPREPVAADRPAARNDGSLVLRAELAGRRLLLLGDLGAEAERGLLASGLDLRAEIVKIAHHGSRTSSSAALLGRTGAAVALVSAACGRAGLPAASVLARLRQTGHALWWTGRDGALLVGLAPRLWVRGWSSAARCELPP